MVESQIRNRGITDSRVLAAMTRVPRDLFIPQPEQVSSYYDGPLFAFISLVEKNDRMLEKFRGSVAGVAGLGENRAK